VTRNKMYHTLVQKFRILLSDCSVITVIFKCAFVPANKFYNKYMFSKLVLAILEKFYGYAAFGRLS
jgi:hypothetical protein